MSKGTDALKEAFRDYEVSGNPATGLNDPHKPEIRSALDALAVDIAAASFDDPDAIIDLMQPFVDAAEAASSEAVEAAADAVTATAPFISTLSDWVLQEPYSTEEGYFYSSAGVRTASSTYRYAIYNVPIGQNGIRVSARPNAQSLSIYKNVADGPSGSATTIGSEFPGPTTPAFVDQILTLPSGTLSIVINSRTDTPISLSAKVIAPLVAERTSTVEEVSQKNSSTISAILSAVSTWQSAGDALVKTPGSLYTRTGTISANASYTRGLYVITGAETGFRFTGRLVSTDSAAEIVYFNNTDGTGFISFEPDPGADLNGFVMTVPESAKSIGFTSRTTTPMVLETLAPADLSNIGATWWRGKLWCALGDSITAQNMWQPLVTSKLGILTENFGISGTKISGAQSDVDAMCGDTRINAIPASLDVLTVMGGTNDWQQNVPLGSIEGSVYNASIATDVMTVTTFTSGPAIKVGDTVGSRGVIPGTYVSSFGTGTGGVGTYNLSTAPGTLVTRRIAGYDPTTFYGALNTLLDKAYARWPLKHIAMITTPYGERGGFAAEAYNALGLNTNDYADAIRLIGSRRNVPVFDVSKNAGWGRVNITEAMNNGNDKLHPAAGSRAAAGIADVVVSGLRSIEPVS